MSTADKVVYGLSQIGFGAGPLILSWINEICSSDTEKRALLVAAGNNFAYVVQAVAPNFDYKLPSREGRAYLVACFADSSQYVSIAVPEASRQSPLANQFLVRGSVDSARSDPAVAR